MKNDLKILAVALEKKLGREHLQHEEKHRNNKLLHKVWEIMKGKEKPSQQTLNRLALLAGFQSWADLHYIPNQMFSEREEQGTLPCTYSQYIHFL